MSSYNQKPQPEEQEEYSSRCPAAGCPMLASIFLDGGPWTCRYHSKQPVNIWGKVTDLIVENKRWFDIIKAAESLTSAEYDERQRLDDWKLDELLRPVKGELAPAWTLRLKETIYFAMREKISRVAELCEISVTSHTNRLSIHQLTSGVLMKPKKAGKA